MAWLCLSWVKFLIFNVVLRVSRRKRPIFFSMRGFSFMCCRWNVYQRPLFPRKQPCPEKFLATRLGIKLGDSKSSSKSWFGPESGEVECVPFTIFSCVSNYPSVSNCFNRLQWITMFWYNGLYFFNHSNTLYTVFRLA